MYTDEFSDAVDNLNGLADRTGDGDLGRPTPCPDMDLATMYGHVIGLCEAFTAAARKDTGAMTATPPDPSASTLPDDWRGRLRMNLADLRDAWARPEAWEGDTQAGGVTAPAEIMGTVALSELVLHGWDAARSIGVDYTVGEPALQAVFDLHHPAQPQSERDGMFGPVVPVPDDAPLLQRLVGLAGRDPFWPSAG